MSAARELVDPKDLTAAQRAALESVRQFAPHRGPGVRLR